MDVQIKPYLVKLVTSTGEDFSKAVSEALYLWLQQKIPTCPFSNGFCETPKNNCNECPVLKRTI